MSDGNERLSGFLGKCGLRVKHTRILIAGTAETFSMLFACYIGLFISFLTLKLPYFLFVVVSIYSAYHGNVYRWSYKNSTSSEIREIMDCSSRQTVSLNVGRLRCTSAALAGKILGILEHSDKHERRIGPKKSSVGYAVRGVYTRDV